MAGDFDEMEQLTILPLDNLAYGRVFEGIKRRHGKGNFELPSEVPYALMGSTCSLFSDRVLYHLGFGSTF